MHHQPIKTKTKVIIKKSDGSETFGYAEGEPFRYPGINRWVQSVIYEDGTKGLEKVGHVRAIPMNGPEQRVSDFVNGVLDKTLLNMDPTIVYDYQSLLLKGHCPSCERPMNWQLTKNGESDKFCVAECCGMLYGMVPEQVRVVSVPLAAINSPVRHEISENIADADVYADADFLKELEKLGNE